MTKLLSQLTDEQLEQSADQARNQERDSIQNMMNHLLEIERRRLFSKRKCTSTYDYAMKKFGYTYHEANRRISAMRLMKSLPAPEAKKIEAKLADGSLHLTHLTEAQTFFRKIERAKEIKVALAAKLDVLAKLENTTKAETKKILYNEDAKARYSFEADKSLEETVEVLKGLNPHLSFDQLMKNICEMAREQMDPGVKARKIREKEEKRRTIKEEGSLMKTASPGSASAKNGNASNNNMKREFCAGAKMQTRDGAKKSRYISAKTKREVWMKADGKCQRCKSTFALEYDHIVPYAMGGTNTGGNLRLLCRSCNQRHALESYGARKMESWINETTRPSVIT